MRSGLWLALQRARQHQLNLLVAQLARGAWTRFVQKAVVACACEALPPLTRCMRGSRKLRCDRLVACPLRGEQNNPRPKGQGLRRLGTPAPSLKFQPLFSSDRNNRYWTTCTHRYPLLYSMQKVTSFMIINLDSGH